MKVFVAAILLSACIVQAFSKQCAPGRALDPNTGNCECKLKCGGSAYDLFGDCSCFCQFSDSHYDVVQKKCVKDLRPCFAEGQDYMRDVNTGKCIKRCKDTSTIHVAGQEFTCAEVVSSAPQKCRTDIIVKSACCLTCATSLIPQ